jgi:hypothetical protein
VGRGDRLIVSPKQEFAGRPSDQRVSTLHLPDDDPKLRAYVAENLATSLQQANPSLINRLLAAGTFAVVNVARSVALLDVALRRASVGTRFSPLRRRAGQRRSAITAKRSVTSQRLATNSTGGDFKDPSRRRPDEAEAGRKPGSLGRGGKQE